MKKSSFWAMQAARQKYSGASAVNKAKSKLRLFACLLALLFALPVFCARADTLPNEQPGQTGDPTPYIWMGVGVLAGGGAGTLALLAWHRKKTAGKDE